MTELRLPNFEELDHEYAKGVAEAIKESGRKERTLDSKSLDSTFTPGSVLENNLSDIYEEGSNHQDDGLSTEHSDDDFDQMDDDFKVETEIKEDQLNNDDELLNKYKMGLSPSTSKLHMKEDEDDEKEEIVDEGNKVTDLKGKEEFVKIKVGDRIKFGINANISRKNISFTRHDFTILMNTLMNLNDMKFKEIRGGIVVEGLIDEFNSNTTLAEKEHMISCLISNKMLKPEKIKIKKTVIKDTVKETPKDELLELYSKGSSSESDQDSESSVRTDSVSETESESDSEEETKEDFKKLKREEIEKIEREQIEQTNLGTGECLFKIKGPHEDYRRPLLKGRSDLDINALYELMYQNSHYSSHISCCLANYLTKVEK